MRAPAVTSSERDAQLEAVRATLSDLLHSGRGLEVVDLAVELLGRVRDDNTALQARLFAALRQLYGRKSERVSAEQLDLFLGQISEEAVPEGAKPDPERNKEPRKRRKPTGREPLPSHLPRERYVVAVSAEERTCTGCGGDKKTIGFVESEVLEFRPAQFVVLVPAREKVACPSCEAGVSIADDDKLAPRRRPGPALLADIISGKWQDSLPIERQADRYKRSGVALSPSTLGDWGAFGLDLLAPVARRISQRVLLSSYLQADDTTLKVLDPAKKPAVKRGHMWAFVAMEVQLVAFLFAPNWAAEHPAEFLRTFDGFLQGDGYAGFARILNGDDEDDAGDDDESALPSQRRLGCGMHIRRKFESSANLGDARGAIALSFFRKIYAVEKACKDEGLTYEQRHLRRQGKSLPLAHEMYEWLEALHPKLVPKSPFYVATHYALSQKEAWLRCFSDGRFEIDNGEVERQLRRVALGRKNFLFAGSDQGGVRAAIAYTILGSCRMHGVDPAAYLTDVLRKIGDGFPQARIDELLPDRWRPDLPTT